jgi:hypothetical protein
MCSDSTAPSPLFFPAWEIPSLVIKHSSFSPFFGPTANRGILRREGVGLL